MLLMCLKYKCEQFPGSISRAFAYPNSHSITRYGRPEQDPSDEAAGTCMIRVFVQTGSKESAKVAAYCMSEFALGMQHYSGNVTDLFPL
jgi:hypothetical protein